MTSAPLVLLVLDGWGHREETEANAIATAAPTFASLKDRYPHTLLHACGNEVGLPTGIMGNSEVGHMNLGAGRVVHQDITRIDLAIEDGSFFQNPALTSAMDRARTNGKALHLIGLVSDGGVHASDHHLRSLLTMAQQRGLDQDAVCIHAITDGRDTPPRSAVDHLATLEKAIAGSGVGRIVSVCGRYWAMDRDKRWDRTERAYDLLLAGVGSTAPSASEAIRASYAADVGDEFVEPTVIGEARDGRIQDGDEVLLFNYRSDRVRQISAALEFDDFDGFERRARVKPSITTFTQYRADFPFPMAFPPQELHDLFPEVISRAGLRQARVAETEKYAHVTFFFNGGKEDVLPGEERTLLSSPKVATYDLSPEMSAEGVCTAVLEGIAKGKTDVFIVNFANADMVGHSGKLDAVTLAVAKIDDCLARIVPAVTAKGGTCVITADHGNAELLWDAENDCPHTAHTLSPVPFVMCGDALVGHTLHSGGVLSDVAPTLLEILGLDQPEAMTSKSLL